MNSLIYLALLAVIVASVSAQSDFNVTGPTQDYFLLSQRQMQNDIYASDLKIQSADARGADSLRNLNEQHKLLFTEIQRVSDSLIPVQALGPIRKYCVQKHKPLLVPYDTAKSQLDTCKASLQSRVNSVTSYPKSVLISAKNAVNINLPKSIASCNSSYAQTEPKLESCVMANVESTTKSVQGYFDTIDKYLETNLCALADSTRDAILCSFRTERTSLVNIGTVLDLVDNCIAQQEEPCPCGNSTAASFQEGSVRNIIMGQGP